MPYIRVKNKVGTVEQPPPVHYASWLDYWEQHTERKATICETLNCHKSAEIGRHVIKCEDVNNEYILPVCYGCNNKPDNTVYDAWEDDLVLVKKT